MCSSMKKTIRYYSTIKLLIIIAIIVGISMSYFIITAENDLDFKINWNMFKSVLIIPLFIVGFILGLGQKFQVYESVIETRDSTSGRLLKVERNDDITDSMMAGCLLPLLNYFVITPLAIAAIIYYSLMAIVYMFAVVFPFIITGFILLSLVFLYKILNKSVNNHYRYIIIPIVTVLFIGIYWLFYFLWVSSDSEQNQKTALLIATVGALVSVILFSILILTVNDENDDNDYAEIDIKQPQFISGVFLITFIVTFLFIIGVYSFKLLSSTSDNSASDTKSILSFHTVISKSTLNVRSGPGETYSKIGSLNKGDQVGVYYFDGDWVAIDYQGCKGYVHSQYLTSVKARSSSLSSDQPETTISTQDHYNSGQSEKNLVQTTYPSSVNISTTTGVINSHDVEYSKFYRNKRITQSEREQLKIDNINNKFLNNELVKGKVIYRNNDGRLETFLHVVEDFNTSEILVSYNCNGDYISHITIGEIGVYSGNRSYTKIGGNTLSICSYIPEDEYDSEMITQYIITSDLYFMKTAE